MVHCNLFTYKNKIATISIRILTCHLSVYICIKKYIDLFVNKVRKHNKVLTDRRLINLQYDFVTL